MAKIPPLEFDYLSISALKEKYDRNLISINKDYQRGYVWTSKQRKNLIDSILDGVAMGVLIVLEHENEKLEILDGQQRITSIMKYLTNGFRDNKGRIFSDLSSTEQSEINAYSVYLLKLKSFLSSDEIANHFIRLQEGTPLNSAEKFHALTGLFRKTSMLVFDDNPNFYSHISNKRFRALFLSAQLFLLELESNTVKRIFPSISLANIRTINEKYKKEIPEKAIKDHYDVIQFLTSSLEGMISSISVRDWISIYLLCSYLLKFRNSQKLTENFRKFSIEFQKTLRSFSIYKASPPEGMDLLQFQRYLEYKNLARQATTSESVEGRFTIVFDIYVEMFPNDFPDLEKETTKEISELINDDESLTLEHKASLVWNYKDSKCEPELLKLEIARTLAAFMNSNKGVLLIGVEDRTKNILGIEKDFDCFSKTKDWDTWQQTFVNMFNTYLGKENSSFARLEKITYQGKTIAKISVRRSIKPVYVNNKEPEFWIKNSNTKQKLNVKEAADYISREFKR